MSSILRKPVLAGGSLRLSAAGYSGATRVLVTQTASGGDKDTSIPAGTTAILMRCRTPTEPVTIGIVDSDDDYTALWQIGGAVISPSVEEWLMIESLTVDGAYPKLRIEDESGQIVAIIFFQG